VSETTAILVDDSHPAKPKWGQHTLEQVRTMAVEQWLRDLTLSRKASCILSTPMVRLLGDLACGPETGLGEINDGFLEADFWPHFIIRPPEITSALPVTLHQRTQPAREHP